MRFGNCVDVIAAVKGDRHIIDLMIKAKFDFAEGNLTSIALAKEDELASAKQLLEDAGLDMPVCNCMFPRDIRIAGGIVDYNQVKEYADKAFSRAKAFGVNKAVLGSDKSRQLPEGYDIDRAYDEFTRVVVECIAPCGEKHGVTILIEPLRKPCNFINTLADGMRVVKGANHPYVKLIADSIHMMTSGEDPAYAREILPDIRHVHVSDWNRALPEFGYSSELTRVLRELNSAGYADTYSFEANRGPTDASLQRSLLVLKAKLGA